jgi:hypothetical protein
MQLIPLIIATLILPGVWAVLVAWLMGRLWPPKLPAADPPVPAQAPGVEYHI